MPIVHTKLLGILDVKPIDTFVLLQIARGSDVVTAGAGFTGCVITVCVPTHPFALLVAVIKYCILCWFTLSGFTSRSVIVVGTELLPALAPVILPGLVPIVHYKSHVESCWRLHSIDAFVLLQIAARGSDVVTAGAGFTGCVITVCVPTHPFALSVAVIKY